MSTWRARRCTQVFRNAQATKYLWAYYYGLWLLSLALDFHAFIAAARRKYGILDGTREPPRGTRSSELCSHLEFISFPLGSGAFYLFSAIYAAGLMTLRSHPASQSHTLAKIGKYPRLRMALTLSYIKVL
ncbi:hypothetical protein BKA70DRAFT_1345685 [Coprinopsis sp. MPI-PUGE-AT-0042]|nr:hypothetical protein BKA70DRAFT_1345685 [Coprinopsis sp. MPI-PUGE-AT-0042]